MNLKSLTQTELAEFLLDEGIDILVGTAILNVNILHELLNDPMLSSWRRMRIIARHLRLWVKTFFTLYKAATKEAHHE